jgi:hypothetical protein
MYKPSGSTAPFVNFHSEIRLTIQFIFSSFDGWSKWYPQIPLTGISISGWTKRFKK